MLRELNPTVTLASSTLKHLKDNLLFFLMFLFCSSGEALCCPTWTTYVRRTCRIRSHQSCDGHIVSCVGEVWFYSRTSGQWTALHFNGFSRHKAENVWEVQLVKLVSLLSILLVGCMLVIECPHLAGAVGYNPDLLLSKTLSPKHVL